MEKPLVDKDYQLTTAGGWTFVEIPEIAMPKTPFGMLKVCGKIDQYDLPKATLMPMGNGNVGLPIKAAVRKKIGKEVPDTVHITLYEYQVALVIPEELLLCMKYEDGALEKFEAYSDGQKQAFINWINSAQTEQTQVNRIAKTLAMVQNGEKFY